MSNFTSTSVHQVDDIHITDVQNIGTARWQEIEIRTSDGSIHKVIVFLSSYYEGFSAFTREDENRGRRAEDVPRQMSLPFDNPPLDD